ncbi:MAG: MaoC family dehydratase N-terminal domain-containing protein [Boseongicola sp.]|nr:MaoC family dehydratase N-terminal domain-containing protein [Boseongicola sp.]MDD9978645.1 MaoC family dehydratase N-terminal domain-containing protein [Boseongicola sp.]
MDEGPNTEVTTDRVDPARAEALLATLGDDRHSGVGGILPPLAHLAFFWEPVPEDGLGHDGHPKLGGLIPDLGLPLRMWAAGNLKWHGGFRAGVQAERMSRIANVERKEGRSGNLAFVTLRHEIRQRGTPVVSEDQTIVYREAGSSLSEPPVVTDEADERRPLKLNEITLFRYSALTFNAHRIHYDIDYCRANGYDNLVVHGPLLATHLAMFAEQSLGPLKTFVFRAKAPLFLGDVAWLCRSGSSYWVEGPRRRLCMTAEAH